MIKYRSEASAAFEEIAREHYRELFRAAHALTGNSEMAELTLGGALLTAFLHRQDWQGRLGNREGLMRAVRSVAALELQNADPAEYQDDWNGLTQIAPAQARHPQMAEYLASLSVAARRAVTLRYGCQMDARGIVLLTGMAQEDCLDALRGAASAAQRCAQQGGGQSSRTSQRVLIQTVRQDMARQGDDLPDIGLIMREVQRDAAGREDLRGALRRGISLVLAILGVAACAALFWLLAILLESPIRGPSRALPTEAPVRTQAPEALDEGVERVYVIIRGEVNDSPRAAGVYLSGRES